MRSTRVSVEISRDGHASKLTFEGPHDPSAALPLVGFAAGVDHSVAVTLYDADGNETSETLAFTAPDLPVDPGEFPPIDLTASEPQRMEPGYTLFNPYRTNAGFGLLVLVDSAGTPVWYYRDDSRICDFDRLANGNLLLLTLDHRLVEIDWLGNAVRSWYAARRPQGPAPEATPIDALTFHHGVDELPNGNFLVLGSEIREIDDYYTSEADLDAPRRRRRVVGDEILEFEPDSGSVAWRWRAFDHLDPFRIGSASFGGYWERRGFPDTVDWGHADHLHYEPSEDSLIVDFSRLAAAIKIDRSTSRILWIFGEPSGWGNLSGLTFQLADDARWPYHPHSPQPTPNATLLIFDGADSRARLLDAPAVPPETAGRAVEFLIDRRIMRAGEVWSSGAPGDEPASSYVMGDVDWLESTGNILVAYGAPIDPDQGDDPDWHGARETGRRTRLREYTHDTPAQLVWEIVIEDPSETEALGWTLSDAERIPMPQAR